MKIFVMIMEPDSEAGVSHLFASTDGHVDKDNAKVGLFIAAAMGTFALMAAVYCIYNKFYTKQQYVHTQLNNDPGMYVYYIFLFNCRITLFCVFAYEKTHVPTPIHWHHNREKKKIK